VKLTHPEHCPVDAGSNVADSDVLLVACLGPNANDGTATQYGGGGRHGRDQGRALRHVYAASPTTGVLCVWVLDTNNLQLRSGSSVIAGDIMTGVECDASVRLKLKPGESLAALTPIRGSSMDGGLGGTAWLLAATSLGRLWKIYKTSRPLTLHAKLVKKNSIAESATSSLEEGEEAGYVRGLYNYFTTPSKKSSYYADDNPVDDRGADASTSDEEEKIVALVPILPPVSSNVGGGKEGTPRSPMRKSHTPPRKQPRISAAPTDTCARALSLSSSLVVKEWKVSLSSGSESSEGARTNNTEKEGYMSRIELFPRLDDGTFDLERLRSDAEDDLAGYRDADVLASPSLGGDGRSLIVVVRFEKEDSESTRVYVVRIGLTSVPGERDGSPYIMDAAWLDRYSGQSLSSVGGTLECAGLVSAEVVEEETVALAGGVGGVVAYVGLGPRGDTGRGSGGQPPCPVTISAVHFLSAKAFAVGRQPQHPRVKDLDLYSNIIPSVVKNSMSYDSITGGCVFLATSGILGGASVRFPSDVNIQRGAEGAAVAALMDESLIHDETVLTIKSHLQSAFRHYLNKLKEGGGNSNNPARAVIPPSIGTCTSQVLSAAVVLASKDFVCATAGGASSSSPFSPKPATSPVTVLRDKLQMHKNFVNFLAHGGAYRRVSTSGRIRLRDHGEMINAARALLIESQSYFSNADSVAAATQDDTRRSELAQVRQMVTSALEGTSDDVTALPHSWARLQQQLPENTNGDECSQLEKDLFFLTSSSICHGIGQALRYRQNESGILYDIPSYDSCSVSSHISPWTSSPEMLEVFFTQLQAIQRVGEPILSASLDFDTDTMNMRQYVEDISASALSGHRDVVLRKPDDDEATKTYEETKLLSIPLLRRYANDDGDDLLALQSSLAHSFFEGIVQICHDHKQSWKFHTPYSDEASDERYDLRPMLSNTSSASPYAHLHQSRDYRTGLPFCAYVLRWYADRGLYPDVFELGKNCPHDLTRYVRNDDRISDLAWIQHLRVGGGQQATVGLLSLNSPVLFGDKQEESIGLWEKDQLMSLAKLSNKLASAKSANPAVDGQTTDLIENNLTLTSAQRILQEDTEFGDEIALNADDLLRLAAEKINSARDVDEIKRYGICGLAIASAKPIDQSESMTDDASSIWHTVIQADIHTWKSIANENSMAVGGISEEELIQRVDGTAFVGVMYDFVTTSPPGGKMQNVGFLHDQVKNKVSHLFGSDELASVLTLSAEIVLAAT